MPSTPRIGVCIVRVETQASGLLITVTATLNASRTLTAVEPSPTRHFVQISDASAAVADFLTNFALEMPSRSSAERREPDE